MDPDQCCPEGQQHPLVLPTQHKQVPQPLWFKIVTTKLVKIHNRIKHLEHDSKTSSASKRMIQISRITKKKTITLLTKQMVKWNNQ